MKKKLVAVAVAGVLGAPLAAHAQTANVTLYGRLNLDFEVVNGATCDAASVPSGNTPCGNPPSTKNPRVSRVSSNSSRFGMRGSEALGGGLTAIFQIESSINGDTTAGNLGAALARRPAGQLGQVHDGPLPDAPRRPALDLRQRPDVHVVDPVDGRAVGARRVRHPGWRLRFARGQLAALRLAVVQRFFVQRPDCPA